MMMTSISSLYRKLLSLLCSEKFTKLIFLLSALFGICPLVFDNGHTRVSYTLVIYSIFFYIITVYFSIIDELIHPLDFPIKFHRNILHFINAYYYFQTIVFFCTCVFSCRKLSNISHYLGTVGLSLQSIGVRGGIEPDSLKRMLSLSLLVSQFLLLCIPSIPMRFKLGLIGLVIHFLGCGQYTALGQEIYCNLHRTVGCLHWMKRHPNQTEKAEVLSLLSKAHHQLCSATEELSSCYGFQMLYIVLLQFKLFTISSFGFLFYKVSLFEYGCIMVLYIIVTLAISYVMAIDCGYKISEKVCMFPC